MTVYDGFWKKVTSFCPKNVTDFTFAFINSAGEREYKLAKKREYKSYIIARVGHT